MKKTIKITSSQLNNVKTILKEEKELEKITLPKFIVKSIEQNKTSLGEHPSFPPSDEFSFQEKLLLKRYNELGKSVLKIHDVDDYSNSGLIKRLSEDLGKAKSIEREYRSDLEKLCLDYVIERLGLIGNDINIECKIVDSISSAFEPNLEPLPLTDNEFEEIDHIDNLEKEIYKRRLINALVQGASVRLSSDISDIVHKIYEISPKLPELYFNIVTLNNFLTFSKEVIPNKDNLGGLVTVNLSHEEPSIKAQGIIFPVLLFETFKGLFEFMSAHGLPENREDAEYIIGKSDFLLAESWDRRFGVGLWDSIVSKVGDIKLMPEIFVELVTLDVDNFNKITKEIFANTRKGKSIISDMESKVIKNNKFGEIENNLTGDNVDDNEEYFTTDELYVGDDDNEESEVELITDSTTTSSIGDFTYDMPVFGDAETNDHTNMIAKGKADWKIN